MDHDDFSSASSGGMRKRHGGPSAPEREEPDSIIKKFDIYQKIHDDYNIKTRSGGTLSLVTYLSMVLLILGELRWYLTRDITDHIVVDTTLDQKLPIGVNMTFPDLRCDEVSVDTVDSSGENQINIHSGMLHKRFIGTDGQLTKEREAQPGECLPCLDASDVVGKNECCNTCSDLKEAYNSAGLSYYKILKTALQCRNAVGCQVDGDVLVSKVAGNVHIALGKSTVRQGRHVHEFNIRDVSDGFNTSHFINRLSFGDRFDGMNEAPLEGTSKIVQEGAFMFHYYVKLIPTIFLDDRDPEGSQKYSHLYSSVEASRNVLINTEQLAGLPGVFIVYEFSPFLVQKRVAYVPLTHFLTSLSVIIGGIFTISRGLDMLLYHTGKRMGSKNRNLAL